MRRLTIAIAAVLAAPVAMANCDNELERIEQRVTASGMDPRNQQVLTDWLDQQRVEHATASPSQCMALAAEIERQMQDKGYFARASAPAGAPGRSPAVAAASGQAGAQSRQVGTTPTGVAEATSPTEVAVQQPPAQVDVQQKPAEVAVAMQPAEVTVRVPDPIVRVVQPPPQVTVNQPDPKVTVQQQDPVVTVQQSEPEVQVSQGEPQVEVQQGEPQVLVQNQPAQVDVDRGETSVVNRQAHGGTVRVGTSRDPRETALVATEPGAPASTASVDAWGNAAATAQGEVAASALVGLAVKDDAGQPVGEITEALKQPTDDAVFVRIDVDPASGATEDPLLVPVAGLERRDGELQLRGEPEAVAESSTVRVDTLEPAGDVTVQLAGEW